MAHTHFQFQLNSSQESLDLSKHKVRDALNVSKQDSESN